MAKSFLIREEQIKEYKRLHKENMEKLGQVIGGKTDIKTPKPITEPNASCLVAHAIANQVAMLRIINIVEGKR